MQMPLLGCVYVIMPLWSSGKSFWLQIQRSQIFWVVVDLERGPLNHARSIEELLEWKK